MSFHPFEASIGPDGPDGVEPELGVADPQDADQVAIDNDGRVAPLEDEEQASDHAFPQAMPGANIPNDLQDQ